MKFFHISLGIFVCILSVVTVALGWQSYGAIRAVKADAIAGAAVIAHLDTTLDKINAPCTGFHGSVTCGTLAQIDQSVKNIGAMAAQSQQQVRQSAAVITAIQASLVGISKNIGTEIAALVKTTYAGTDVLKGVRKMTDALNDPKTGVAPVLAGIQATVAHTDSAVTQVTPQVVRAVKAAADTGESTNKAVVVATGILQDGKDEADKLVHPPKVKLGFWGATWLVIQKVHSVLPPWF